MGLPYNFCQSFRVPVLMKRRLAFGLVARAELAGQAALLHRRHNSSLGGQTQVSGLPLSAAAQQAVTSILYCSSRFLSDPFGMNHEMVRAIATYGLVQTGAEWVFQLRGPISTVIVGTIAGPELVGVVSLAQRLVEALSFIRSATKRMAVPGLGQIKGDTSRLVRALNRATLLQILGTGVISLHSFWSVRLLFHSCLNPEWRAVLEVFPLLAAAAIGASIYNLHSAVLYVYARNLDVGAFHLAYVSLLFVGVEVFVPEFGAVGYGYAELIALSSCGLVCWFVVRLLRAWPNYGSQVVLALAFALALVWPTPGCVLGVVLVAALQPQTWLLLSEGFNSLSAER